MIANEAKTPSESYTEQVHMVNAADLNGYKRLFGGTLMAWIDIVAATAARRHAGTNVTTATIDTLNFLTPAYSNDLVVLTGKLTYVGNTSMEVCVKTYVEQYDGKRNLINEAHVVLVALDSDDKPTAVPPLAPQTDEERDEYEAGRRRKALRKKRSIENY